MKSPSQHQGFTLIELVVVIVILGILAATALPKFVDLGKDARIAKVNAMAGALKSAATQGRSICAIVGGTLCPTNTAVVFNYQGKSYNFVMGYPEAGNYLNGGQIDSFVDTTGFTLSLSASTDATRFSVTDAPDPANCWANYEQAKDVNTGPKITTETKGCGNS